LIADLAELARGDHRPQQVAFFRLDELVEDALNVAATHGRSRGVQFALHSEPTWVEGHHDGWCARSAIFSTTPSSGARTAQWSRWCVPMVM